MKTLVLEDDILVLDFPYDKLEVEEIKAIAGTRWDKRRLVWTAPIRSLNQIVEFAQKHDFEVDTDVLLLNVPEHKMPESFVDLEDGVIRIAFNYDRVMVTAVKEIAGVTWDRKSMAWKAPTTSVEQVVHWAELFHVPVDKEVLEVGSTTQELLEVLTDASRATDANVEVPGLQGALLPYQKAGVAYAVSARRTFIADEMGLGKTIQAMASIEMIGRRGENIFPCLVVCPPNLVLNWQKEWNKFFPDRSTQIVVNRKEFDITNDIVIVGYSNLKAHESVLKRCKSFVFDESHYCKSRDAQRTKAAKAITKSAGPEAPIFLLTGTPVTNRPMEYGSQLEILGQIDKFGGLWGFYRRYCDAFKDRWGQWHLEGASNLTELNERLRATCYIRRLKEDVLADLPPVSHDVVLVEPTGAAMREYRKAEKDIVAYIVERAKQIAEEMGLSVGAAAVRAKIAAESNEHLMRIGVLRKLAAKAKMAAVEEWIEGRIDEGLKIVVAAHHREIVDLLAHKYGGLKIQGGMDIGEVEEAKELFQTSPEAPVIVLSIQAAKTGHTLTASQNVLFVELPWTPADVDQTVGRCHRLGQKGSVTATFMLAAGTIDEEVYDLVEKKRAVVDEATDGGAPGGEVSAGQFVLGFLDKA